MPLTNPSRSSGQAYTQTYSAAARTVPEATATSTETTAATAITPYGFSQAQADAIPVALNALLADMLDLRKVVNGIVDDLQSVGVVQ
jgi:hypothetical protein